MQNWTVGQWASLVTVIGSSIGGLSYGLKLVVIKPLMATMDKLNDSFKGLDSTLKLMQTDIDHIDERIDKHETRITVLETINKKAD